MYTPGTNQRICSKLGRDGREREREMRKKEWNVEEALLLLPVECLPCRQCCLVSGFFGSVLVGYVPFVGRFLSF